MFEKVNPMHPDKICDRIGGAIIDLAYLKSENPKVAGECLLGHGDCHIILETDVNFDKKEIVDIVHRIAGKNVNVDLKVVPQDSHLSNNQKDGIRCGDNGIFKGVRVNDEEKRMTDIARLIYNKYQSDGKYIFDEKNDTLIVCQSKAKEDDLKKDLAFTGIKNIIINPLGEWDGGCDVDTGAVNRKLGSDLGRAVTGGGIHFKDISKADVAVNVFLHLILNDKDYGRPETEFECKCAIGDTEVTLRTWSCIEQDYIETKIPYKHLTSVALDYIKNRLGGFEKMAEWGLI